MKRINFAISFAPRKKEAVSSLRFRQLSWYRCSEKLKCKSVTCRALFCQIVRPLCQSFDDLVLAEQCSLVKIKIAFCIHVQYFESSLFQSPYGQDCK